MTEAWSIRRRLPLLLMAVLVLVVGTLMAASYVEVRTQTLAAVEERLARIASQVGTVIDTSAVRVQLARLDALAGAPTTIDLLVGRDADSTSALALLRTASPGNVAHVGLWSTTGTLVLEATSGGLGAWARTAPPVGDSVAIGAMRAVDDTTVFYDIVAPVRLDGRVVGSLVVRRRLAPATNAGIQAVLGPSGRLLIGNADGSLWMEGPSVVAPPPETVLRAGGLVRYERDGGEHYGVVGAMASTPWSLLFEVGHAEALAPATAYLERILIIAAALLALGVVAAWGLGRRLTAPLDALARAVSKISAGDYGTRVALSAPVEAAQLGAAVNSMAEQVQFRTRELAASEAMFRSLVSATSQIVWHARPDGAADAGLPSWQAYTGQSDAQVAATGWMDAVHPEDRARFDQIWDQARQADGPFGFECRLRGHDGTFRLFAVRGVPVRSDVGAITEWVGTCQDIELQRSAERDLRRAEDELRHAQKMEAIGRLAGGVAHDFNNLLTGILAPATFAREQLGDDHPVSEDIDAIRTAALRAAELTKQLLTFSRAKSLRLAALDLNEIVRDSVQLLKRVIGEQIEIRVSLADCLGAVKADRAQLDQVILNLAVNARDAMPKGGTLTMETQDVELDAEYVRHHPSVRAGPFVLLAVSDTGVGMDEATLERIFEPFFTTKAPGMGTGLGLATVHGIVQQAGGHVWVYSEPGHGTTFKIYLPMSDAPADVQTTVTPRDRAVVGGSERILLVEDDERVRTVTVRSLQRFGYEVIPATGGQQALDRLAEENHFAIVVTDMVMPGMSGAEMAATIRRTQPRLPILFLSGYAEAAATGREWLNADEPFLPKPFTPEDLARMVRGLLDAGRDT